MKTTTRTLFAGLIMAAAAAPALAADQGVPANLQAQWDKAESAQMAAAQDPAVRYEPQYLITQGEDTLVRNPAFRAEQTARTPTAVIVSESAPSTRYVGA